MRQNCNKRRETNRTTFLRLHLCVYDTRTLIYANPPSHPLPFAHSPTHPPPNPFTGGIGRHGVLHRPHARLLGSAQAQILHHGQPGGFHFGFTQWWWCWCNGLRQRPSLEPFPVQRHRPAADPHQRSPKGWGGCACSFAPEPPLGHGTKKNRTGVKAVHVNSFCLTSPNCTSSSCFILHPFACA